MTKYKYRGPVNRRDRDGWSDRVVYEDWYHNQNDGIYIQIYEPSPGNTYKVFIRINSYDFQSYGKLYVLRQSGWIEYLTVEATLLKSMQLGPFYSADRFNTIEVLEAFRSDATEILNILIKKR